MRQPVATSEGKGIRCGQCGGTFPMSTLTPGAGCPFCGAPLDLGGTAVREARQYREDVFAAMREADAQRSQAAAWGQWKGRTSWPMISLAFTGVMMVVPCLFSVPAYLLSAGNVSVPPELHGIASTFGSLCTFGTMAAMMVAFVVWQSRRTSARAASDPRNLGSRKVACPHCGAPNELAAGQHVETCGHCRGALMPSKTVMIAGLDAARAERRRATLERYRAERAGMLNVTRYTGAYTKMIPFFYAIVFAPVLLGICVVPFSATRGHVTLEEAAFVGLPILFVIALVAGVAAFFFVRWRQAVGAWRGALANLASQFRGRVSEDVQDFVSWLNAGWAGPYDVRFVGGGPRFAAVTLDAWGFSALVALNPKAPMSSQYQQTPTYARVLLAAWIPSRSDGGPPPALGPEAQATMNWLAGAGFLVSCEEAGILAMAQENVVAHLRKEPASAHQLAPVIGHLARLANEIGARPVQLTPGPPR